MRRTRDEMSRKCGTRVDFLFASTALAATSRLHRPNEWASLSVGRVICAYLLNRTKFQPFRNRQFEFVYVFFLSRQRTNDGAKKSLTHTEAHTRFSFKLGTHSPSSPTTIDRILSLFVDFFSLIIYDKIIPGPVRVCWWLQSANVNNRRMHWTSERNLISW